jgi:shikimate dehydrogenase
MHNAGFKHHNLTWSYELRSTSHKQVQDLLGEIRQGIWHGGNITTPLKVEMAEHFQLENHALRAGAVNTFYRRSNRLRGALTDVQGVMRPLQKRGLDKGCALVIGAGGAARAAILAVEALGFDMHVLARRAQAAQDMLEDLKLSHSLCRGGVLDSSPETLDAFKQADLVIQATPVGRAGDAHNLPWDALKRCRAVFDMVYSREKTPFLSRAQERGIEGIEGWEMLLYQGVEAFELWTEKQAPVDVMKDALLKKLHVSC